MRHYPFMAVAAVILATGLLETSPAVAQPAGAIAGQVTDASTNEPLGGAQVVFVGTNTGVTTSSDGRYRIEAVPGVQQVRVVMLGYSESTREVEVAAGETAVADFALEPSALALDELVVTATGEQRRRELGNAIAKVDAAALVQAAPVTNFQELLSGRSAGVNVLPASGTIGSGSRIRIRGLSSASLSNDPLIYIDGVRVETSSPPMTDQVSVGGGEPSFFNQINPEEIESIEIVKGPSASTLYGTQAANGVVRITTKRGQAGRARWNVYGEAGVLEDPTEYPALYYSAGRNNATGEPQLCLPYQEVLEECTIEQLHTRNLMHDAATSPLRTGYRHQWGAQVSGGTEQARYFISAEYEYEMGTLTMPEASREFLREEHGTDVIPENQLDPNYQKTLSLRGNLNVGLSGTSDLSISSGYVTSHLQLPQTGDNLEGIYGTAMFGTANPDAVSPWGFAPPDQGFAHEIWRETDRFINSANLNWRPTAFLAMRGTVGLDYLGYTNNGFVAAGQGCGICGQDRLGTRTIEKITSYKYSVDVNGTATFDVTPHITSKTSLGVQYNRDELAATFNSAFVFPPGGRTIDAGSSRTSSEETTETVTRGSYLEQQFGWRDRLFVTGALRVDQNSAFGQESRSAVYPKASISFLAFEEPQARWLNSLRLRGAYGASGLQPEATAALRFFEPATASVLLDASGAGDAPAAILGGLGNETLKPERSNEFEIGFDVGAVENRVSAELTYYHKRTVDALVERALPGSLGATDVRVENIGEVVNKGFEIGVTAEVIRRPNIGWEVNIQASTNDNELVSLGEGVPPIVEFGFVNRPGYPLFGAWWPTLESFDDADDNGIITPDEVVVSDTSVFGGSTVPTRQATLSSNLTLMERVRLSTLVEYRGGFISHNVNSGFQCIFIQNCRALNDPSAPLPEQARALAGGDALGAYWEDAAFIKLREASLSVTIPAEWIARIGASSATVTLTDRNLATITDFTSWDPELNTAGAVDGPNYNFVEAAQLRTFALRVNLGF